MGKKDVPLPAGTTRAVGTDGEILFDGQFVTIKHKWNANSGRGESRYPLTSVTGVEVKPGLVTAIFTLIVSGGVQRGDAKRNRKGDPLSLKGGKSHRVGFNAMRDRILQAIVERDVRPTVPEPERSQLATSDLAGQLHQLGALHAQGVLNDVEFAAAKARLLSVPTDAVP